MKKAVVRKKTESYSGYRQLLFKVKEKCRQILTESAGEDAPLFCAMALGDKQDLDPETQMRYQLAGIIHILAISGLHISILGMGLYNLLKEDRTWNLACREFFRWGDAAVRDHDRRECFHHACSNHVSDRHGRQDHRTDL